MVKLVIDLLFIHLKIHSISLVSEDLCKRLFCVGVGWINGVLQFPLKFIKTISLGPMSQKLNERWLLHNGHIKCHCWQAVTLSHYMDNYANAEANNVHFSMLEVFPGTLNVKAWNVCFYMKENGLVMWKISNGSKSILIKEIYGKMSSQLLHSRAGL